VPNYDDNRPVVPALVFSPHFDDGILSCGAFLAQRPGSVVATAHTARPSDNKPGNWDLTCGFGSASEAMDVRVGEDQIALKTVGASSEYGCALDSQYPSEIADHRQLLVEFMRKVLDAYSTDAVLIPLGLVHRDHIETRDAALSVCRERPSIRNRCALYTDLPYGPRFPESIAQALEDVANLGWEAEEARRLVDPDLEKKLSAVNAYESQVRTMFGLPGFHYSQVLTEEYRTLRFSD